MTSFLCEAVVLCASRKIEDTCVRNSFSGVSCGTSAYGDESLDAVEARELSVCTEDLCDTAADVRADLVVDVRPGIAMRRLSTQKRLL